MKRRGLMYETPEFDRCIPGVNTRTVETRTGPVDTRTGPVNTRTGAVITRAIPMNTYQKGSG